ncbi:Uu.00g052510.m01.CDS01 [Anthostomella pinea]|uniref:Uu.00g052510.m01.CDS01 n=1 Tax=Anthostomella pinea TaxID=933095 RepID=A0AAI8VQK1_9PEZI|nr:Uu.00g052510.m01.CDS01 [Anthostomella pinea]
MKKFQSLDTWKVLISNPASAISLCKYTGSETELGHRGGTGSWSSPLNQSHNAIQKIGQLVALPFCDHGMCIAARGIIGLGLDVVPGVLRDAGEPPVTAQDTQTLINRLLTPWTLVQGMAFSLMVNGFGRRTLFLASTAGCRATYVIWTALEATYERSTDLGTDGTEGPSGIAKDVVAMNFLYQLVSALGWGKLQITYVVEILPFNLRARLGDWCLCQPPSALRTRGGSSTSQTCGLRSSCFVVYFLFVEAGKLSVEETAAVLDGGEMENKMTEETIRDREKTLDVARVLTQEEPREPEPDVKGPAERKW